jgi:hypothetical protein
VSLDRLRANAAGSFEILGEGRQSGALIAARPSRSAESSMPAQIGYCPPLHKGLSWHKHRALPLMILPQSVLAEALAATGTRVTATHGDW